ncbi:hypothetical protein M9458_057243 [Cirrhinus mrigala]|uniref:Uncharacterized protein n=1 Tax=Cirrhinus mrigala TaxID=683832 RepID=A0ABD0MFC2_CIRMR
MGETRAPNIRRPPRAQESPPKKGQRRARSGIIRQPQCRRPRGPWRQARRLRQQPATPEQTGPWARRSKGPPPPSRGPAKPGGPCPAKQPPRAGQRSPEQPAPERGDRKTTPVPRSSREDHQPRPRPDGQLVLTAPSPGQRTENRGQGHPDQGPRQPGAAHQTPQQRKNYPHPIIQSTPRLQKAIDTQLKRPPDPPTRQRPPHQGRAQAHAPTHAPGSTPTRTQAPQAQPESQPGGRAAPEPQAPPGPTPEQYGRQAGNLRPPAQASPAAPHAAARKTTPKSQQHPIQARPAAPAPNPPRNPPLGNSQMPPAHMAPPRRQQKKPKPDRTVTPTHTRLELIKGAQRD